MMSKKGLNKKYSTNRESRVVDSDSGSDDQDVVAKLKSYSKITTNKKVERVSSKLHEDDDIDSEFKRKTVNQISSSKKSTDSKKVKTEISEDSSSGDEAFTAKRSIGKGNRNQRKSSKEDIETEESSKKQSTKNEKKQSARDKQQPASHVNDEES